MPAPPEGCNRPLVFEYHVFVDVASSIFGCDWSCELGILVILSLVIHPRSHCPPCHPHLTRTPLLLRRSSHLRRGLRLRPLHADLTAARFPDPSCSAEGANNNGANHNERSHGSNLCEGSSSVADLDHFVDQGVALSVGHVLRVDSLGEGGYGVAKVGLLASRYSFAGLAIMLENEVRLAQMWKEGGWEAYLS